MEKSAVGNKAIRRILGILRNDYDKLWTAERAKYRNYIHDIHDRIRNRNVLEKMDDFLAGANKDMPSLRFRAAARLGTLDDVRKSQRFQNYLLDTYPYLDYTAEKMVRRPISGQGFRFTGMPHDVGPRKPDTPWWGIGELIERPFPTNLGKAWDNLPKYLRNAYPAGHTVVPPSKYNMEQMAPGFKKTIF